MKQTVGIAGIGFCVPSKVVSNEEFIKYVDTTDEWIKEKIGIHERRFAAKDEALSDLAYPAAVQALENAEITARTLDLIVVCAINQDYRVPATATIMQKRLHATNAAAFDVNVGGCPGSCYSLIIAQQFIESGMYKNVLVISGDIYSKFVDVSNRDVSVFFGDGVGAVVLRACKKNGFLNSLLGADGEWGSDKIVCPGGSRIPFTKENFETDKLKITMDNKEVWKFGTKIFPQIINEVVEKGGYQLDNLDWVIPHQANINMIKYGMKRLKIPMTKTYTNIQNYGNTGAGSVIIALAEAVYKGFIKPGDLVVLASFGAGFSWGAILLRWCEKSDFIN